MTIHKPRILFAGTSSGSGKTTAVCAILTLLARRGIAVTACKCGPDYIDPMFHESVLGVPSASLDPFFCDGDLLRGILAENGGELAVIEGVMGYYDGTGPDGTDNSTWTVARETKTPVVLVINGRGASASLLAVLEGFLNFVPDSGITGVLFNNTSPMVCASLKRQAQARFGERVRVLGCIPKLPEDCVLGSRHLGLITAPEIADLQDIIGRIADECGKTIDLDALVELASCAPDLDYTPKAVPNHPGIKLAVARDAAFCFYYKDTLRLFERMGAELLPFSPLADEPVPDGADGLLLGGGYPELYAERLEANEKTKQSVAAAIRGGMPTIAECGGFQYLGKSLDGKRMCGILPHESTNAGKLVRFGYVTLTAQKSGLLGEAGIQLRAHEFHYWDSTENGDAFHAEKPGGRSWDCCVMTDTLFAGYPHLFLPANIPAAEAFYKKCLASKEK